MMTSTADVHSPQRSNWCRSPMAKACILFFALSVLLNLRILLASGVPVHGDLTYPWDIKNYVDNYRFLFNDSGSISNLESMGRAQLLVPVIALVQFAGGGTDVIHKLFFVLLPFIAMTTSYILNRLVLMEVFPNLVRPRGLVLASVVYGLSPWVMEQVQAYLFWLAYALTPLLIVLVIRFARCPTLPLAAGYCVVLSLIATTPQYLAYSLIASILVAVIEVRAGRARNNEFRVSNRALFRWLAFIATVSLLLNFYWIYPAAMVLLDGTSLSPGYTVDRIMTDMFSTNSSAINVLRGFDQWVVWYQKDDAMAVTFSRPWILNSLALPLTAMVVLAAIPARRSLHLHVVALLALLFAVLSLGANTPLLDWAIFEVEALRTFGWLFRVPGKMSYMLWVFYAACLPLALSCEFIKARGLRHVVVGLACLSCSILLAPKVFRYFYFYYVPLRQPAPYAQLDKFMRKSPGDFRVLYMAPYESGFGSNSLNFETSFTWNAGRLATATPEISSAKPSIGYYHLTYRDWQHTLYRELVPAIPPDLGERLLSSAGVKFLVYHDDIVGGRRQGREDLSELSDSDLKTVARLGGYIHIFENPYFRQLFVGSSGQSAGIETTKMDPTRYELKLDLSLMADPLVVMGQPFDRMWRLHAGGKIVRPERTPSGMMSFHFPTGVSAGRVEYFPQPFYEQGLALSMPSMAITVAGIAVSRRRRR